MDGSTLLLNFQDKDQDVFLKRLATPEGTQVTLLKPLDLRELDPPRILQRSKMVKKWLNYEVSTLEYLMFLNRASGRS